MKTLFYRNRQLLSLSLLLIFVWGLASFFSLPRMEDPELVQRFGTVTTFLPGASPERVETLITDKLEDALRELPEIKLLESSSSRGISVLEVELQDTIPADAVDAVWAKVRGKLQDIEPDLPPEASKPRYEDSQASANALIVALGWTVADTPVNFTILGRSLQTLKDQIQALAGTDTIETFGLPREEIQVNLDPVALASRGLTPAQVSQQIQASDAKITAGQLQTARGDYLLELDSNLDSLERIRQIPLTTANDPSGQQVTLGQVATVAKGWAEPMTETAIINGFPAVTLAARVESRDRVDVWATAAREVLQNFAATLPPGLELTVLLDQSQYVQQRLNGVLSNLVTSAILVWGVSLCLLGWKSALIIGSAIPLTCLMVFGWMSLLGIPLHQMSVTGLIIALGLLIDNAIVVVDEIQLHLQQGDRPRQAIETTVGHLWVPLLASTLTTVLAFVPIATSPGGTGEFIGSIGMTVILALLSSLVLSLTIVAALVGRLQAWQPPLTQQPWFPQWLQQGLQIDRLTTSYHHLLLQSLRRPWLSLGIALILPLWGFIQFSSLEQQFFPPTNRDQFQVELLFPAQTALTETQAQAQVVRKMMQNQPEIQEVQWFVGKSAPPFFYNVIPDRENTPYYAQALVQLDPSLALSGNQLRDLIHSLQTELDAAFPTAQVLVRQLEQGPPISAPIELRLGGSDLDQLRQLGDELRTYLAQIPTVIHTRADLGDTQPKLAFTVDEVQAKRLGLDHQAIAQQMNSALGGQMGGSLLEGTEEVPVRVRWGETDRQDWDTIAALELLSPTGASIPLDSLAKASLVPNQATIPHYNGQRVNTVQGFLQAGTLPATTLVQLKQRLQELDYQLPPGYSLSYGGEADARGTAIASLLGTAGVLVVLMVSILVLSFQSFSAAALIGSVALAAVGLAALALWFFNALFGFTAILGTLGLMGLAINDSIVVLAALREDPIASQGHPAALAQVTLKATRHVIATTVTTIIGFVPLLLDSTGFWPPLAIAIAGGLGGATFLALFYIPPAYLLLQRHSTTP